MPKNIDWDLPENFCIDLSEYNLRGKIDDNYIYTCNQKETKIKRFINSNYDLGYIPRKKFDSEINKYSFNWRSGGQFADQNNEDKIK